MVILKKDSVLTIEQLEYKTILEEAVKKTNDVVDRWKEVDTKLISQTNIEYKHVESLFLNFLRRPLFPNENEFKNFKSSIALIIDPQTKHVLDIRPGGAIFACAYWKGPAFAIIPRVNSILEVLEYVDYTKLNKKQIFKGEIEVEHE